MILGLFRVTTATTVGSRCVREYTSMFECTRIFITGFIFIYFFCFNLSICCFIWLFSLLSLLLLLLLLFLLRCIIHVASRLSCTPFLSFLNKQRNTLSVLPFGRAHALPYRVALFLNKYNRFAFLYCHYYKCVWSVCLFCKNIHKMLFLVAILFHADDFCVFFFALFCLCP